jgi:rubrerythrin
MKTLQSFLVMMFCLLVVFVGLATDKPAAPPAAKKATTLDNLMTSFNGESNAQARYLAFAKKADAESFGQVASLFRAAARAEEAHAADQAEVIKKMGGTPKADIKTPDVKSTKENLEAALKGETYEKDVMYADFIKQARAEKKQAALESFNEARTAEAGHAKLYGDALAKLDTLKGSKAKDYFVCSVCGYTVEKITFEKCPSCFNPVSKYVKVN